MKIKIFFIVLLSFGGFFSGCDQFLDEKTDKKLVMPSTLADLQAMLDFDGNINTSDPGDGEVATDDYYLADATWAALSDVEFRRAYTWEPYNTSLHGSWNVAYRYIYNANIILEHLNLINNSNSQSQPFWSSIAGQAYFLRARGHLAVQLIWALAYDENTADTDLGIPLRLSSDFNIPSYRPSNRQVYAQIIDDLEKAIDRLPNTQEHALRASKPAAFALLARTYLFMRDYEKSFHYADACLQLNSSLIDYNVLDPTESFPIPQFNIEVLHHSQIRSTAPLQQSRALVDTNLYALYADNDLRKSLFFRDNGNGTFSFKGSYNASQTLFSGISVDEVFLIRAECYARQGNIAAALADLNHLLVNRYKNNIPFSPLTADSPEEALQLVLTERRKELVFRSLRFPDVKRLNKERMDIAFSRVLNGEEYVLPPNDPRFALAIPENVLERAPGIVQNPR